MTQRPLSLRSPSAWALLLGFVLAALWWSTRALFPIDDTYITFRYAENVANGLGIVWNAGGAHTEGYTNFLFMLLLVPFAKLGAELLPVAQVLSLAAVVATGALLFSYVRRTIEKFSTHASFWLRPAIFAWFALALYYADPLIWMNALSGMETTLFGLAVMLALWLHQRRYLSSAFALAFVALLIRPEGGLLAVLFVIDALIEGEALSMKRNGLAWRAMIYFVVPTALFAIWKLWYFGNVLPNSFYVKVAQPNAIHTAGTGMLKGFGTLRLYYTGVTHLVLLAVAGVLLRMRMARARSVSDDRAPILWCVLLSAFYLSSVLLQPQYERFTYTLELMLIVLSAVGAARIASFVQHGRSLTNAWPIALGLIAFAGFHTVQSYTARGASTYLTQDRTYENRYPQIARIFRSIPDSRNIMFAWSDAGLLPYESGMKHLDVVGLNYTPIARAQSGEEVLRLIADVHPDIILLPLDPVNPSATDTCRTVIRWGHGLIGPVYNRLMSEPKLAQYKAVALLPLAVYDLNVMVDTTSSHYPAILATLQNATRKFVRQPAMCVH